MDTYTINSIDTSTGNINLTVVLSGIGQKTFNMAGLPLSSLTDLTAAINNMVIAYKAGLAAKPATVTVDSTITGAVGVAQTLTA